MPRPRQGTFEPVTLAGGRIVYRGRLRLADGSRTDRFDLSVDMNERQTLAPTRSPCVWERGSASPLPRKVA
jgi:hypothetical protein